MPQDAMTAIVNDAMRRSCYGKIQRIEGGRKDLVCSAHSRAGESSIRMIATCGLAGQALNCRAAAAELVFQPLETAVEVIDAVDDGLAFGRQRGDDERYRGAQIVAITGAPLSDSTPSMVARSPSR